MPSGRIKKWKFNNVYEIITNEGQDCISLRWVNTAKFLNGKLKIK